MRRSGGHLKTTRGALVSGRQILIRVTRLRWRVLASAGLLALLIALGLDQSSPGVGGVAPAVAAGSEAGLSSVERESAERSLVPEGASGILDGKFGSTVALSGDGSTALIGAPYEDGGPGQGEGPGSVWVFTRLAGQWLKGEQLEMPEADSAPGACGVETPEEANEEKAKEEAAHACRYGIGVALSQDGDTAVIGAPHVHGNSGAVFIFTRSTSDPQWALAKELTNPLGAPQNRFGRSVAISAAGNTVLVGAPIYAGRAFVFTGEGSTWEETAELVDPAKSEAGSDADGMFGPGRENEGEGKGLYGQSVALSADGQTALIGSPGYPGQKGAAWVFHDFGPGETQTHARLEVSGGMEHAGETEAEKEAEQEARFGASVALSGDGATAMVGAPGYEGGKGAAWVFTDAGTGAWPEQAVLTGVYATKAEEEAGGKEQLGRSVALSYDGDVALAGAPLGYSGKVAPAVSPGPKEHDGVAWLFERSTSLTWSALRQLRPYAAPHPEVHFGSGVALSDSAETRLVGGRADEHQGAAWLFGPNPSVKTVQPNKGPVTGGTTVTITGEHLTEATVVRFGETEASEVSVAAGGKSLTAVSPPGTGTVEVSVKTPIGKSAAEPPADQFTYVTKEGGGGGGKGSEGERPGGGGGKGGEGKEPSGGGGTPTGGGNASSDGSSSSGSKSGVLPFGPFTGRACGASLVGKRFSINGRHDRALVKLRGTGAGKCAGKLTLRIKVAQAKIAGKKTIKLRSIGTADFAILAGQTRVVSIKLNAVGRRLLRAGRGHLNASLSILKSTPLPAQARNASVRLTQQEHRISSAHKA